jgi:hypothetical protein
MEEIYSRMAKEARHQYTLAYEPNQSDIKSNYHTVEVHILREGVSAQTRQGYYGSLKD